MKKRPFYKIVLPVIIILLASSKCGLLYVTSEPIDTIYHQDKKRSNTLVIFLPGRRSGPDDFKKYNFVSLLKKLPKPVDSVAVDAHIGYYIEKNLGERLYKDIIKPAKKEGYTRIWLTGISLGGTGALHYSKQYPATITGIILLAPYLGEEEIVEEINKAGGLSSWKSAKTVTEETDDQRALWAWLKEYPHEKSDEEPLLYLGYGKDDKFAASNDLLAKDLPPNRALKIPGYHDWPTWKILFTRFVKAGVLE
ncbi:MAG: alpha/beta hydrolase [bacterium]|nr:alpha/beta hydrolase [bacterium]